MHKFHFIAYSIVAHRLKYWKYKYELQCGCGINLSRWVQTPRLLGMNISIWAVTPEPIWDNNLKMDANYRTDLGSIFKYRHKLKRSFGIDIWIWAQTSELSWDRYLIMGKTPELIWGRYLNKGTCCGADLPLTCLPLLLQYISHLPSGMLFVLVVTCTVHTAELLQLSIWQPCFPTLADCPKDWAHVSERNWQTIRNHQQLLSQFIMASYSSARHLGADKQANKPTTNRQKNKQKAPKR